MESTLKCEIGSCANTALYYQKDFKVYICEEHSKMTQSQNCEKLEDSEGIEETLKVLEECIKNFSVSAESEDRKEDLANNKEFIDSFKKKLTQISTNFNLERENQNIHQYSNIRKEVASIAKELMKNPFFQKFCIHSYISLMCDYLSFDQAKVEKITDSVYEQEEDPIEPQELLPVHPQRYFQKSEDFQRYEQQENKIKALERKFDQFKKDTLSMLSLDTSENLIDLYELITESKLNFYEESKITLDCASSKSVKFMKLVNGRLLPDYPRLKIDNILPKLELVREFMTLSFPQRVRRFDFNTNGVLQSVLNILDIFRHITPRVTEELYIYNFKISANLLNRMLSAKGCNYRTLGLIYCKINLEKIPNLKDAQNLLKIKTLNFGSCGGPEYCDWEHYPERFSNLIKGLSKNESCKVNLRKINLLKCGLTKNYVRRILDNNGFNITVIDHHSI